MIDDAAPKVTIQFAPKGNRHCGDCQLCCRLMPIKEFSKPAGERCQHQKHGVGCAIYARRPWSCAMWNCRWLVGDDTADLRRPDRSHYVIDIMPDFVTLVDNDSGERTNIEVVQIWCDPKYPHAHRDPALRAYIDRRGQDGIAAIIRYSELKAFTLFPPSMATDGQWHEQHHGTVKPERTPEERFAGIAAARKAKLD
jgi:hypothetical protein